MNYLSIYKKLIEKRKHTPVDNNEYSEVHHIIPKCLGGNNNQENLIRLTAKEHFIAHELLYKHYQTPVLAHAWFSMLRCDSNQKRYFTSRQYERARKVHIEILKITMKGENNPFYGKSHTEETRKKLSKSTTDWFKNNKIPQKQLNNWIEKVAKKPASEKQKQIASENGKNKIMLKNIHTKECIRVDKSKISMYNSEIWKNPSAISQKRDKCLYCGIESVSGNIKRWHNENCKKKFI